MCHDLDQRSYLKGQGTHTQNLCPGHNSSLPFWIWIVFRTIFVHDPRVCYDLDPKSYLQGQGHSANIPKIRVRAITPNCHVMMMLNDISHNCCSWPKSVPWPWPKVISPRPQCILTQNLCLGHNSSLPCWIWIIFHTIVIYESMVFHDLDPRSYLQGQGQSAHIP